MDQETQAEAKKVEKLLDEIKENTTIRPTRNFMNGVLQGAGIVVGTIVGIALIGWLLSIFGVIPGFNIIVNNLTDILKNRY
ncbi:MAG: hypothetical protein JWL87_289 [Candidatus Adlerbacteria bacterium]|nr:hypothetical protein [Candidatus Adlerbacteria bacterium]